MTTAADDSALEEAFEACLAGRAVPRAGDRLGAFADGVRASASEPAHPSAALSDLLATGLLTDLPSPSTATARPAHRRKRRSRMLATAFFTKLATAGLAAKAAAVTGVAVVGLTTAGFTGSLPDAAQHTFATVVDSVTPLTAPDPEPRQVDPAPADTSGTTGTTTGTTVSGTDGADDGSHDGADVSGTAPAHPSNFGGTVSSDAKDGGVDGQQISQEAHVRNQDRKDGTVAPSPAPSAPGHDSGTPAGSGHGSSGSSHGSSGKGRSDH